MPAQQQMFGPIYPWYMLLLLGLIYFLSTATTFTSLGVVLPSMINEFNWNWAEAGLGFTILGLTCGLSSYLPTLMIRKLGLRITLLFGLAIFTLGFYYLYSTTSLFDYFSGTALLGIGFTF